MFYCEYLTIWLVCMCLCVDTWLAAAHRSSILILLLHHTTAVLAGWCPRKMWLHFLSNRLAGTLFVGLVFSFSIVFGIGFHMPSSSVTFSRICVHVYVWDILYCETKAPFTQPVWCMLKPWIDCLYVEGRGCDVFMTFYVCDPELEFLKQLAAVSC